MIYILGYYYREDIEFFLNKTRHTVKTIDQKLSYGVLVKDVNDYVYLNNAVRDNR